MKVLKMVSLSLLVTLLALMAATAIAMAIISTKMPHAGWHETLILVASGIISLTMSVGILSDLLENERRKK